LASVPHSFKQERATVPPIVLPITSRGIALTDRVCWGILGVAMALAAALILYLNRGSTFYLDELDFLYETPGLGIRDVIEPHNGHLIATTRLVYKAILETIGADYVAFRLLAVGTVLLTAGVFYALVKRYIGALPALAPTLILLFFGSAWQHVALPIGFTPMLAIAAGLAALLALERDDRRGDIAACALLVLSVVTYSSGLPFIVGVAISVLLRPDRLRRVWIFVVPLTVYAAWWAWSQSEPSSSQEVTKLSNGLLIPVWSAESLATALASVTGLSFSFSTSDSLGIDPAWGRPLAVIAVAALVLRLRKGNVPDSLWVAIGIVLTWWALGALSFFEIFRTPDSARYVYLGSVGVLLAASAAVGSVRFSSLGLAVLFAACAVSLATNIWLLREGTRNFRIGSTAAKAGFAMVELARNRVDPAFDAADVPSSQSAQRGAPVPRAPDLAAALIDSPAGAYLGIVDRYGSLALPLSELARETEGIRETADQVLTAALGLRLEVPKGPGRGECTRTRADGGEPVGLELPSGGATLRSDAPAEVRLGRFGGVPTAKVGSLPGGGRRVLEIPPDASSRPWHASLTGARSVAVCPLG
jgi:hypothetical protein